MTCLSPLTFWLLLMLLFQKRIQQNRFFTSPLFLVSLVGLLVAVLFFCPLAGISLANWSMNLMPCVSFPFVGLLLVLLVEQLLGYTLFTPQDWRAGWIFGACGSLVLYPAALGLGRIDPYSWGWGHDVFFILVAFVTLVLLIAKNRFAILLFVALAAFDGQLQGSTNFWDYLIDPVYAVVSLVMSIFFCERISLNK